MDDRSFSLLTAIGWGVVLAGAICVYLTLSGYLPGMEDVRRAALPERAESDEFSTSNTVPQIRDTQPSAPSYPDRRKRFRLTLLEPIQSEMPAYSDEDLFICFVISSTTVYTSSNAGLLAESAVRSELLFGIDNRTDEQILILWD